MSTAISSDLLPPRASLILATLNERRNLPELLDRIARVPLPNYELLVVDDGSTDGTREYIAERARSDSRLRLLLHNGKQTTLRAQCQAIAAARGTYLVIMDADLQHPPETIPALLKALEEGSVLAIASRYAPGGTAGPRALVRAALSRGAEWLAKLLLRSARGKTDPVSGFFAFRKNVWVPLNESFRGYKLLLFLLVMAHGQRVTEVGFRFEPRVEGQSKVARGTAFMGIFLRELVHARRLARDLAGTRAVPLAVKEPSVDS